MTHRHTALHNQVIANLSCPTLSSLFSFLAIDVSLPPPLLISDAVKRSSVAHLFHFYPVLCEIASIPRKTPSGWFLASPSHRLAAKGDNGNTTPLGTLEQSEQAIELDARVLARACLKEVGKEMGVSQ